MPVTPGNEPAWLNPKWLVIAVAVAAFGLIASYDWRLGMAAGTLLGLCAAVWLFVALRYGSLSGAPSGRGLLAQRVQQQSANRRRAAQTTLNGSGPQQRPDLPERP
ncbi:MAG TPA: hypothetical protein VLA50_01100 [Erythrobacter sp.]|nr:hypothetical protein [Erythrobacter sp.]